VTFNIRLVQFPLVLLLAGLLFDLMGPFLPVQPPGTFSARVLSGAGTFFLSCRIHLRHLRRSLGGPGGHSPGTDRDARADGQHRQLGIRRPDGVADFS